MADDRKRSYVLGLSALSDKSASYTWQNPGGAKDFLLVSIDVLQFQELNRPGWLTITMEASER